MTHPILSMLPEEVRALHFEEEVDALSRQLRREKVGDSLSVRSTLIALSLDKRLRQPAPAKASRVRRK
jgi:hypothetical protein